MARDFMVFANFQRGDFGNQGDFNVGYTLFRGRLIYDGAWTGTNVVRYVDGSVGPRWGAKESTVSGLSASKAVRGAGIDGTSTQNGLWIVQGDTLYLGNYLGSAFAAVTGTFANSTLPADGLAVRAGGAMKLYFQRSTDGFYSYQSGGSLTKEAVGNSPEVNAVGLWLYGPQLLSTGATIGGAVYPNRIYYTDATNGLVPLAWQTGGAQNYFDVGDQRPIKNLFPARDRLYVQKKSDNNGGAGEWWVITGVFGVNASARRILAGEVGPSVPLESGQVAVVGDYSGNPGVFNGATLSMQRWMPVSAPASAGTGISVRTAKLRQPNDWLAARSDSNGTMWVFRDAMWSHHPMTELPATGPGFLVADPVNDFTVFVCDGALPPRVFVWQAYSDRPFAPGVDTYGAAPAAGVLTLPEFWERDGQDMQVRSVLVDFEKWDAGTSGANKTFTVNLTPLRVFNSSTGGSSDGTVQTAAFNEAHGSGSAVTTPVRDRRVFNLDTARGNGWRLSFTNLANVSIQKAVVIFETMTPAGVS